MSQLLAINQRPGPGLALLTVRAFGEVYKAQLWASCKARKPGVCNASGTQYDAGTEVYRPVGNSRNRSMRILAAKIDTEAPLDTSNASRRAGPP